MQNKLSDLNNHLFAQMERLGEEGMTPEQIQAEVHRANAMRSVAQEIIKGAALQLSAVKLVAEHGDQFRKSLTMITGGSQAQNGTENGQG